jgi:hypothetical protein
MWRLKEVVTKGIITTAREIITDYRTASSTRTKQKLNVWGKIIFENLTVAQLVEKFTAFTEPKYLLPS